MSYTLLVFQSTARTLALQQNSLVGTIPSEIGLLTNLGMGLLLPVLFLK
jgi:hypothetical protein